MSFSVGSLVNARGREWLVLPDSDDELLMVRPLGGTDDEATGILTALEAVTPASFELPDPTRPGDARSARLLRDALRLGFRSSAGPFRSFGRLAVEPRPYQLVPLLMALRLDPVRLLIADDVGIGKTVEAALVARELLDQGDARRLAVLCPPHLAEQWQAELSTKFHLDAELVLASTAARLERGLRVGQSIFEVHPHVIVSTDFIKSERHRRDFLRTCPELVIVDEAHTCAEDAGGSRRGRHQRYELVAGLAADPTRHLVLVTATPHSGKEEAFRSRWASSTNSSPTCPPTCPVSPGKPTAASWPAISCSAAGPTSAPTWPPTRPSPNASTPNGTTSSPPSTAASYVGNSSASPRQKLQCSLLLPFRGPQSRRLLRETRQARSFLRSGRLSAPRGPAKTSARDGGACGRARRRPTTRRRRPR